jgi:hypothetical protein
LPRTNALAYYENSSIATVKSFITFAPDHLPLVGHSGEPRDWVAAQPEAEVTTVTAAAAATTAAAAATAKTTTTTKRRGFCSLSNLSSHCQLFSSAAGPFRRYHRHKRIHRLLIGPAHLPCFG